MRLPRSTTKAPDQWQKGPVAWMKRWRGWAISDVVHRTRTHHLKRVALAAQTILRSRGHDAQARCGSDDPEMSIGPGVRGACRRADESHSMAAGRPALDEAAESDLLPRAVGD